MPVIIPSVTFMNTLIYQNVLCTLECQCGILVSILGYDPGSNPYLAMKLSE